MSLIVVVVVVLVVIVVEEEEKITTNRALNSSRWLRAAETYTQFPFPIVVVFFKCLVWCQLESQEAISKIKKRTNSSEVTFPKDCCGEAIVVKKLLKVSCRKNRGKIKK